MRLLNLFIYSKPWIDFGRCINNKCNSNTNQYH